MRYADAAYQHILENPDDTARVSLMDAKARAAGFEATSDYIDHLQGAPSTRSFEGEGARVCWVNEEAKVFGWNNKRFPEASTVVPSRDAVGYFEINKGKEERALGFPLEERGPLLEADRLAAEPTAARDVDVAQNASEGIVVDKAVQQRSEGDLKMSVLTDTFFIIEEAIEKPVGEIVQEIKGEVAAPARVPELTPEQQANLEQARAYNLEMAAQIEMEKQNEIER